MPWPGCTRRRVGRCSAIQSWLAEHDSGTLVVATRGAVAPAGRGHHRSGGRGGVGSGAFGADRASRPDRAGGLRCATADEEAAAVLAVGEPQVLLRGGTTYIARVHGSRAVGGLLVPPGDGPWRLGMSSCGHIREPADGAEFPTPTRRWRRGRCASRPRNGSQLPRRDDRAGSLSRPGRGHGCRGFRVVVSRNRFAGCSRFAVGDRVTGLFPEGTGDDRHHRRATAGQGPGGMV